MLEPKRGRKGRRYDVMLNYSKKALVNTGQGAKRANPRVYTAAASVVQLGRTKRRNHWKLILAVTWLWCYHRGKSVFLHNIAFDCKYVGGVVMREVVFFMLNILV